ncbi:MAG TPA: TraB/GumN family protein [Bacteroidetes bacterium]|nr:TraB/GumN family protein [Bacteroidota bacterium]
MNIKKYNLLILILITGFILSCKTIKTEVAENEFKPLQNSLLWKIESDEFQHPSYIFGTIHIIDSAEYFLPSGFQKAFDKTENVVFEIDMKKMNDPATLMNLLPKIMMRGDTSLKDLLSKEDYSVLQENFKKSGIPLFLFEKVKPLFLTMFTEGDIAPGSIQSGKYKSYEMEIMDMAKEQNKSTGGLETIEYQVSVLDSIPYKEQAKMLMESINAGEEGKSQMKELVDQYKQQNINALHQSIKSDDISRYEKILLNNRNQNWIPVIKKYMSKKPTFFAVGAGHLGGKDGVINLLRKKGFKVTPVMD